MTIDTEWIRPEIVVAERQNRAGLPPGLQLICGAGPFELEVLIHDLQSEKRLEIAGQVTDSGMAFEPVNGLSVELVSGREHPPVAETKTNDFGEFSLVSGRGDRYGLRLGDGPSAPCVLVWEDTP